MSISPVNLSTSLSVSNYTPPNSAPAAAPATPAVAPAAQGGQQDQAAYLEKVNAHVNDALKASDSEIEFSVHKGDNRVMIRLVDSSTHAVLKEMPSEKYLDMVDQLSKLAAKLVGLHTDVKL